MRKAGWRSLLAILLMLALPSLATAGPIGTLQLASGAATLTSSSVQLGTSASPGTGIFSGIGGTTVLISDLSLAGGTFATFAALPGVTVSVTLAPGVFSSASCGAPAAAGQQCALAGSPINFYNTDNGSVASLSLNVTVQDGANTYQGTGIITTQFGESYQEVLATMASGGTVQTSYSTQLTAGTAGSVSFSGSLTLSNSLLDFQPTETLGTATGGQFLIAPLSTGDFQPLIGTTGIALNLTGGALNDFLTFAASPTLSFDLTSVETGVFSSAQCFSPAAVGQTCTVPLFPSLEFANVTGGSILSFNLDGLMSNLSGSSSYEGIFSMQFAGLTYQQVLTILTSGGSATSFYSATLSTAASQPVPEPTSLLLIGTGVSAALWRRRSVARRR